MVSIKTFSEDYQTEYRSINKRRIKILSFVLTVMFVAFYMMTIA